jgi:hypothetical protein
VPSVKTGLGATGPSEQGRYASPSPLASTAIPVAPAPVKVAQTWETTVLPDTKGPLAKESGRRPKKLAQRPDD